MFLLFILKVCVTLLKKIAGVLLKQKELTDELVTYQDKVCPELSNIGIVSTTKC